MLQEIFDVLTKSFPFKIVFGRPCVRGKKRIKESTMKFDIV